MHSIYLHNYKMFFYTTACQPRRVNVNECHLISSYFNCLPKSPINVNQESMGSCDQQDVVLTNFSPARIHKAKAAQISMSPLQPSRESMQRCSSWHVYSEMDMSKKSKE